MRDRLIELLKTPVVKQHISCDMNWEQFTDAVYGSIADNLLANGVIVPPCKVSDTVYMLFDGEITPFFIYKSSREENVDFITSCYEARGFDTSGEPVLTSFCDYHIGKTVFLTKEEAERVLKEREKV